MNDDELTVEDLERQLPELSGEQLRRHLSHLIEVARESAAENVHLHGELKRKKDQLATARRELRKSRQTVGRLERAVDGYDEEEFDPAKQRGVGCIPIGGDFRQVEAIEQHLLKMGPTLESEFARLGIGDGGQVARILEAHADVQAADVRQLLGVLMSIALKARFELGRDGFEAPVTVAADAARLVVMAVDQLPKQLLTDLLDVESWDGSGMPPVKPMPLDEEEQRD